MGVLNSSQMDSLIFGIDSKYNVSWIDSQSASEMSTALDLSQPDDVIAQSLLLNHLILIVLLRR
jgi:hypothetical protein